MKTPFFVEHVLYRVPQKPKIYSRKDFIFLASISGESGLSLEHPRLGGGMESRGGCLAVPVVRWSSATPSSKLSGAKYRTGGEVR